MIRIFTDGACSSNPGPGGYAAIINMPTETKIVSGYEENTTNNRMELKAVIFGMKYILEMIYQENNNVKKLEVISDSAYVINAINQEWITNWKRNKFKNAKGDDIKNIDLWSSLDDLLTTFEFLGVEIVFTKVKGHNGNYFNEQADKVAKEEITKNRK